MTRANSASAKHLNGGTRTQNRRNPRRYYLFTDIVPAATVNNAPIIELVQNSAKYGVPTHQSLPGPEDTQELLRMGWAGGWALSVRDSSSEEGPLIALVTTDGKKGRPIVLCESEMDAWSSLSPANMSLRTLRIGCSTLTRDRIFFCIETLTTAAAIQTKKRRSHITVDSLQEDFVWMQPLKAAFYPPALSSFGATDFKRLYMTGLCLTANEGVPLVGVTLYDKDHISVFGFFPKTRFEEAVITYGSPLSIADARTAEISLETRSPER